MNALPIPEDLWLQIDQAAMGCCSGSLSEWPVLQEALRRMKIVLPPETGAVTLIRICRAVICSFSSQCSLERISSLVVASGRDRRSSPIMDDRDRSEVATLLREILAEADVPRASGHRWDFR